MQILVTGGAGFIGSHLCERLIARGDRVTALDDLSTGRLENVEPLIGGERFELQIGSVCDPQAVERAARGAQLVLHLAAGVGVRRLLERPVQTVETNVRGTEVVLREAAQRCTPVFLASSSEVYGRGEAVPFSEEDDLRLGPPSVLRYAYACSKALDEWLAMAWHAEAGLPVIVGRFFNTAGPRQTGRHGMVLPRFVASALAGETLEVHGSGRQTRCFCHVRDTVEAVLRLIAEPRAPHVNGRVFNIGTDREVTILELARLVADAAGSCSPIALRSYEEVFGPAFEDMRRRVPDISRLERATGFRPRISLEQIVGDVVADLRERAVG